MARDIEETEAAVREVAAWLGPEPTDRKAAMVWAVRAGAFRTILRRTMAQTDDLVKPLPVSGG